MRDSSIHRDHGDEDDADSLYRQASELEAKADGLVGKTAELVDALMGAAAELRREADAIVEQKLEDLPYEPDAAASDDIVTISAPPGTVAKITFPGGVEW